MAVPIKRLFTFERQGILSLALREAFGRIPSLTHVGCFKEIAFPNKINQIQINSFIQK